MFGFNRLRLARLRMGSCGLILAATPGLSLTVRAQPAPQGIISMPSTPLLVVPAPTAPALTPPPCGSGDSQSNAQESRSSEFGGVSTAPSNSKTIITARGLPTIARARTSRPTLGPIDAAH
jgi:hypothetical protein